MTSPKGKGEVKVFSLLLAIFLHGLNKILGMGDANIDGNTFSSSSRLC